MPEREFIVVLAIPVFDRDGIDRLSGVAAREQTLEHGDRAMLLRGQSLLHRFAHIGAHADARRPRLCLEQCVAFGVEEHLNPSFECCHKLSLRANMHILKGEHAHVLGARTLRRKRSQKGNGVRYALSHRARSPEFGPLVHGARGPDVEWRKAIRPRIAVRVGVLSWVLTSMLVVTIGADPYAAAASPLQLHGALQRSAAAGEGGVGIISHRGAAAEAPENTLAAFRIAIDQGVDFIETPRGPVVVEVNPRLTASYAGLRESLACNPARRLLDLPTFTALPGRRPIRAEAAHVH